MNYYKNLLLFKTVFRLIAAPKCFVDPMQKNWSLKAAIAMTMKTAYSIQAFLALVNVFSFGNEKEFGSDASI